VDYTGISTVCESKLSVNSIKSPLISVLMNCYNGEKYLQEAVESVLAQTYTNWEIIFWDNQSTDRSAEIVLSYSDKRIKYFYAPTHEILGDARREAINNAKGTWIGILDSDDVWCPNKLQDQLAIINEENQRDDLLGLVYGKVIGLDQNSNETSEIGHQDFLGQHLPEGAILSDLLLKGNFIMGPSILFSIKAFNNIGGFPKGYIAASDYYVSCAISSQYRIRSVNSYIAKYRIHDTNLTHEQKIITYEEQISTFQDWYKLANISQNTKVRRIREINVFAGLMMIKHKRLLFKGLVRITKQGSLWFCIKYVLTYFMQKTF
jgi:glycosyltransferase involved in cell wall biosynthesis